MKPSPSVNNQEQKPSSLEELREKLTLDEKIGTILRTVRDAGAIDDNNGAEDWTHSEQIIQNAKPLIKEAFRSHMEAVIDESYELGRTHELERHNSKNSDERDTRQYDELLQLSAKYLEGDKTNHE